MIDYISYTVLHILWLFVTTNLYLIIFKTTVFDKFSELQLSHNQRLFKKFLAPPHNDIIIWNLKPTKNYFLLSNNLFSYIKCLNIQGSVNKSFWWYEVTC